MSMGKIIYKKKGELVPDQLLEKLFHGKPTLVDLCMVDQGALQFAHPDNVDNMEEFKRIMEVFKDYATICFFGYDAEYLTDDRQPFVLVRNSKDQPVLAVCMQGDFSPYHDEKSAHSDEFHALNKYFRPKLQKIFSLCKEDIPQFLDELRDPVLVDELSTKTFLNQGSIEVLSITGEVFSFVRDDKRKEFKWGFTSDTLGHDESEYPEKTKGGLAAALSGLPGFKSKAKTEAPKAKPEPETPQEVMKPPVVPAEVKEELIFPPAEIQSGSKNQIRAWYNEMFGFCPDNYKRSPGVLSSRLKKKGPIKALSDIARNVPTSVTIPAAQDAKETMVDIPVIPAEKKKQIEKNFLESKTISKLLADQTPFDPKSILEQEGKYSTFCENFGLKTEDTFKWGLASYRELCRRWPDETGILISNLIFTIVKERSGKPAKTSTEDVFSSLPGFKPKAKAVM